MNDISEQPGNMNHKRLHVRPVLTRISQVALAIFTLMAVGTGLITGIWYLVHGT